MKNNYSAEEREKLKQFQDINGWIKFIDYPPKKYTDILISDGSNIYIAHYAYEILVSLLIGNQLQYYLNEM